MNRFDLSEIREVAYRELDKSRTVDQVRTALAEQFDAYRFTLHTDGSIFAVPVENDYVQPTRIF